MKKTLITALALCAALTCSAQAPAQQNDGKQAEGYQFTDLQVVPTTPIKNQHRSGTCWSYSTLSYLESEILRAGGEEVRLSEMWVARNSYMDKAEKYVRLHGHLNFGEGGALHDVTDMIRKYGIVPFEAYPGLNYGTDLPDFREVSVVMKGYLDAVIAASEKTGAPLSTAWKRGFNALLDQYFGVMPETFVYNGKEYTPRSFAESLPINPDDYVELTSFTHHPFYSAFVLEVPDNWSWGASYNLPLDELMSVVDYALSKGYTVAWSTDVSEKGFSRTKGLGIVPDADLDGMSGTESARWGQLTEAEKEAALYKFDKPGKEKSITQQMRQEAYDNYQTTDDHGMVIVGTAVDQLGNQYYKVQNSWDTVPPYAGFWYFSRPYAEYKTLNFMVNKEAMPKEIRKKLGL